MHACTHTHTHTHTQRIAAHTFTKKANNIEKVTVITAQELGEAMKEKLLSKLEKEYAKKIVPEYKVDADIIGGIIIRTENSQTDASVRSRLDAIKAQLSSAI